jgi:tetratricopeptide (TPR) repeat protein
MSLPRQLLEGSALLGAGRLDAAEKLVRGYLQQHGPHVEGVRLLAQIAIRRDVLDDAELLLEDVVRRAPDYHEARRELAAVLGQRRRYLPALMHVRHLLQIDPRNRDWGFLYAKACDGLSQFDEALRVYRLLLAQTPGQPDLELAVAHLLRSRGDLDEALVGFQAATRRAETQAAAFRALADVKTYRFTDEEVSRMRHAEAAAGALTERYELCFALGKALEDRREFEESFRYYERGNALRRSELTHDPDLIEHMLRLQATVCTAGLLAERSRHGCPRPDPIFIVGLPRSGSTLIEQILGSHSQIDATLELAEIPRLVQQFRPRGQEESRQYPWILGALAPEELRRLGEIYLEETRVYRHGAPFFIDKNPANFRDIGFIHLILPNARFIDARREPMACCFGNFKQLFVGGQEFTYDLGWMGRYYRSYVEVMNHWDRVLPGRVLRVQHEDVVNDLEGSVRRMLDFCGLEFEESCLEFYRTRRSIRTLSSEQVRRPISRDGLNQWRNYEPWLGPLAAALGPLAGSAARQPQPPTGEPS